MLDLKPPASHSDSTMRTRSRGQGWTPAVGSVNGPSRGRGATGETRRFRPFAGWRSSVQVEPNATLGARVRSVSYLIRQRTFSVQVRSPGSPDPKLPFYDRV